MNTLRLEIINLHAPYNFMAIISRRDNPRLQEVIQEFEDTISFIFDWFFEMEKIDHHQNHFADVRKMV